MQMLSLQYRLLLIHLTEHASRWRVECSHGALSPLGAQTPPLVPSEGDDSTKVLHTGGWGSILWVSEQQRQQRQRHVIQTFILSLPRFPHTSCGISKHRGGTLLRAPGSFCVMPTLNAPTVFHHSHSQGPQNPC